MHLGPSFMFVMKSIRRKLEKKAVPLKLDFTLWMFIRDESKAKMKDLGQ